MPGELGAWFGRKTAIRQLSQRRTFMTRGSPSALDQTGAKIHWRLGSRIKTRTWLTAQTWAARCEPPMAAQLGLLYIPAGPATDGSARVWTSPPPMATILI